MVFKLVWDDDIMEDYNEYDDDDDDDDDDDVDTTENIFEKQNATVNNEDMTIVIDSDVEDDKKKDTLLDF